MLVAPQFKGLDLPIYDPETPVLVRHEYDHADELESPTFIRQICVSPHHTGATLSDVLKITDSELTRVAELCGSLVVGYQWGLQASPRGYHEGFLGIPAGYRLVAEVDTITRPSAEDDGDDARSEAEAYQKCSDGLMDYRRRRGTRLYDMREAQFMWGSRRSDDGAASTPHLYLVDIEPRLLTYTH